MIKPQQLYHLISEELLQPNFLNLSGLTTEFIVKEIRNPEFLKEIENIINNNEFSCKAVYNLCKPTLDKLWGESSPPNPLYYIYQYALSYSFPNSVVINLNNEWKGASLFYLQVFRAISKTLDHFNDNSMSSIYPIKFLSEEESKHYKVSSEYYQFKKLFHDEYILEMMKLNQAVMGYNTLDHISGVHHLALFLGKQLYNAGMPIDLGRVSGAAAGHDLGKYGCKESDGNRVAYLHYYYTDLWFKNHDITYIGHIALNHSVWDLELENLSIESLILIYSDFRVKNFLNSENKLEMKFFSLKESFDVILNKLDNVDNKKQRRYIRVYNKLKDFENFIRHIGVEVDPNKLSISKLRKRNQYYSLMRENDITEHLKYLAINHNIHLMHQFRDETSLSEILEIIRSENHPRFLREYLDILQEYSTYLTQNQKIIMLRFLYEKLTHPEEDIRRHSAELMGNLIALFDEDYRKEIPEGICLQKPKVNSLSLLDKYLELFINPSYQSIPLHRKWIGYSTKVLITSIFKNCSSIQNDGFKEIILKYYKENNNYKTYINICLLDIVGHIPLKKDKESLSHIFKYVEGNYKSTLPSLRVAALKAFQHLLIHIEKYEFLIESLNSLLTDEYIENSPAENYLKLKLIKYLNWDEEIINKYTELYIRDLNENSNIYLSNLKTATNWLTKKVQVKMQLEHFLDQGNKDGLYTAMHYCNLLKVSAIESVRNSAGKALIALLPHLPIEQRNDIAVELLRALELESYQFTKFIPTYLGQVILHLQPFEIDEIIEDIVYKIKQSNNQIKSLLIRTVGIIITSYPYYKKIFSEKDIDHNKINKKLLGILLNGLAHDDLQIRQISFSVLGKRVFGSKKLSLEEKHIIFQAIGKKILTLLVDTEENKLLFLTNSSGLNHIYRFIAEYSFKYGPINVKSPERLALFTGSFDPFTLSHKEICKSIRDKGFEVYLTVDEFSWSKRTQPHLIRKKIINMSIADEMDIYLYPENFPLNISNDEDLKTLKEKLGSDKVYIVVGSDVILNASAYKAPITKHSIHQFPHVIFERRDSNNTEKANLEEALKYIKGDVIQLNIPPQYEDISSSQIRKNIDSDMDISNLIDPLAHKYIHENSLYRREPQYKSVIQSISVDVNVISDPSNNLLNRIIQTFHGDSKKAYGNIRRILQKPEGKIVLINDIEDSDNLLAYGIIHWIPSDQIYQEFNDVQITSEIRDNYKGRIISLDGFFINFDRDKSRMYQIIITETLAYCLKNDYGYAVYHNKLNVEPNEELINIIKIQGFIDISSKDKNSILAVDMSNPCTLNLDLEPLIKEPFKTNLAVMEVIRKTRTRLQMALTDLYPGNLVLAFDSGMINEIIARKICLENNVPTSPTEPRQLGPLMCVPFGNILSHTIVPNTITKSLHVEKMFNPDMKSFKIEQYPYYLTLPNQVKMIGSFNKPVILVDDLLHKGYRIKGIDPLLKKQNINVHKIIVGLLSGRGKELMDIQKRKVDCAYFVPKLKLWFNENQLYPFIGGDTLWRGVYPKKNILASINLILPYTSPHFIKGVTNRSIYNLSEVCIINAMEILEVLEDEYQRINERKLTLSLLSDVLIFPRYPDEGANMSYDFSINPSSYIRNDLELLRKLEHSIITGDERRK
jgi:nicotinic acid mononucleotide adenylyltransferase